MKRKLIITSTLLAGLLTVGCGQNNTQSTESNQNPSVEQSQNKTVSMDDIKSAIITEELLATSFGEPTDAKEFYALADIADKIEDGFICKAMMNVKFRDIVVVKTSDVEAVKSKLEDYLASDAVRSFKDGYGGEDNIEAVSNAIINNEGDYAYLIATPNASDIESKLLDILK